MAGSRRAVKAVRTATILSYIGAAAGVALAYYLTSVGNFALLTPIAMVLYQVLWLLPTLLLAGLVKPGGDFAPCLRQPFSMYTRYAVAGLPSAGRKISPMWGDSSLMAEREAHIWKSTEQRRRRDIGKPMSSI